jgi:hypothetical protein
MKYLIIYETETNLSGSIILLTYLQDIHSK